MITSSLTLAGHEITGNCTEVGVLWLTCTCGQWATAMWSPGFKLHHGGAIEPIDGRDFLRVVAMLADAARDHVVAVVRAANLAADEVEPLITPIDGSERPDA